MNLDSSAINCLVDKPIVVSFFLSINKISTLLFMQRIKNTLKIIFYSNDILEMIFSIILFQ